MNFKWIAVLLVIPWIIKEVASSLTIHGITYVSDMKDFKIVGLNGEKRHKFSFQETPHKFIIAKLWILKLRFFLMTGGGGEFTVFLEHMRTHRGGYKKRTVAYKGERGC